MIGTQALLEVERKNVPPLMDRAADLTALSQTVVFMAVHGRFTALISVADPVEFTSVAVIRALRAQGRRMVMITGDGEATVRAIAD